MAVSLDSLRKAVKKNKGRSQALAWLADMERAAGDYEAALKTVDAALAASPSDVPAMLVRAKILAGQQDFAGSITEYKKVLAKDPFCLSAHKRMGESYDKLGKEAERNACFRRVHDMDPLDPFWKDEYDVLPEEETLVPPVMDDSSFTMDVSDDTENAEAGEDNIFANLAASLPNTDEEDNTSMEALRNSLNFASDEIAQNGDAAQDASFEGHALNSSEVSSAISDILGGDDDLEVVDSSEKNEPAAEEPATSSLFSHFSDEEEKIDAIEEPKSEEVTEEKSDDAEFSLDSLDEPLDADEKSTNVDDAFSSLLGDDELPEEAPSAEQPVEQSAEEQPAEQATEPVAENLGAPEEEPTDAENLAGMNNVPAMHMDFSDDEDVGVADDVFDLDEPAKAESKAEEAETNVDDAFSSLLGDDELPEEKDSTPSEEPVNAAESAEEVAEPALETQSEEQADVEKPLEESVEDSFGSLFEKSADADFSLDSEAPAAEETAEKPLEESVEKPEEESAEDSFSSLFEKSADADFSLDNDAPAVDALEKAPEFVPNESAENVAPAEGLVPTSHMDFSDDEDIPKADDDFVLNLDEELPTESETPVAENAAETQVSESLEEPAEETLEEQPADIEKPAEEIAENVAEEVVEAPAESLENVATADDESAAEEVDGAFDALFGDDDEAPAEATAETPVEEQPAIEQPVAESNVEEQPVEESPKDEDLAKEMGGAFASMFGEDDSMPTESAPVDAPASETTESVEEPLSQEATSAEFEEEAVKEDVEKSVDESFDSIFGADADDLPEEKSEVAEAPAEKIEEAPAEEPTSVFSAPIDSLEEPSDVTLEEPATEQLEEPVAETAEPVAEEAPSAELDSIDSEVSNAFKGLFDEDDSLPESDEPNNNGVDYLMSGDSDDEVAASLVENADAPLSRGATDLDDSLNTRTLADIYMEQGVYDKALDIYTDLAKKNPDNEKIKSRLEEVKKLYREKFGEV
ncbi:tetratricopeptide repeat protein [Fibrobacter sp. UWB2]|uniref:tetratricopeptide repeat protein n=1 Tax=Fibrobacter sp. UWB2 TaxID=1964358 RepID=UPI001E635E77|nr:tetratricopeptide repeat protein [Fibrobacter sp. UWB2]